MKTERRRYIVTGVITLAALIYCLMMYRYIFNLFEEGSDLVARNIAFFGSIMIPIYFLLGIFYLMTLLQMKEAKEYNKNQSFFSDIVFMAVMFSLLTLIADVIVFQSLKSIVSLNAAKENILWLELLLAIRFVIAASGMAVIMIDKSVNEDFQVTNEETLSNRQ